MNKNCTCISIARPLKAAPSWFQLEADHFQALVSELPDCKVLDFLKRNNVAGRDPYELERDCMEKAHLAIFLPEYPSNLVGYLLSYRLEKLGMPTLVLVSRDVEVSETFIGATRWHHDICLFERYGGIHSLERDGVSLVTKALKHFAPRIEAMKERERKVHESALVPMPESD